MSAVCTSVCTNNAENGDRSDMKRLAEALRKQLSDDERQRLAEQLMANQAEEDVGGFFLPRGCQLTSNSGPKMTAQQTVTVHDALGQKTYHKTSLSTPTNGMPPSDLYGKISRVV